MCFFLTQTDAVKQLSPGLLSGSSGSAAGSPGKLPAQDPEPSLLGSWECPPEGHKTQTIRSLID